MTRIWRLSARGKAELEIQRKSIPFSSPKLQHYLRIADVYVILRETGKLRYFQVEPRETYTRLGKERLYAPDALYVFDRSVCLLEVQISRLSRKQWEQKWKVANTYFNEGYYREASWQRWRKADHIKPEFVVISPQEAGIVREGFDVHGRSLRVVHSVEEIRG